MHEDSFCEMFYAAHYLPIAMYEEGRFVCASGFYKEGDPYPFVLPKLMSMGSPAIYVSSDTGYYGMVRAGDGARCFVLGPAYSTPVTDGFIRSYISKNAIPPHRYEEIASFLRSIPQYTYNQFLNLLLYLQYTFTGERLELTQAFGITDTSVQAVIGNHNSRQTYAALEEGIRHGTYSFEQRMLDLIRNGEAEKLEVLFLSASKLPAAQEGKLAESPLRQAKDIFIGWTTLVGKCAAIPGGLDVEQTYRLIDTYIQECEKLQTEDAVKNLQYVMSMDFVQRVAQQKLPEGVSKEVYSCMQFISSHINEPIGADDVVAFSGKSRACLFQRFSRELGMSIGAYITRCRLREAKALLRYTDQSLGEISSYLCFSSQSHFQNVFKKHIHMTPGEYRSERKQ